MYDPALLPNFDPSVFGLTAAKLAQQDVFGVDGKLVAPWDMATKLHPSTLVAVEANHIVYSFCKPSNPSTISAPAFPVHSHFLIPVLCQTFQVQAHRIQILEESPSPIGQPTASAPVLPAKKTPSRLFSQLSKALHLAPGANAKPEVTGPAHASPSCPPVTTIPVSSSSDVPTPAPSKRVTRSK